MFSEDKLHIFLGACSFREIHVAINYMISRISGKREDLVKYAIVNEPGDGRDDCDVWACESTFIVQNITFRIVPNTVIRSSQPVE